MRKADHINVNLFHHKPMQPPAQKDACHRADCREEDIFPKDIGCRFVRIKSQHLDGGNLPDSFGDVDVGQIIQHHKGKRTCTDDNQYYDLLQAEHYAVKAV